MMYGSKVGSMPKTQESKLRIEDFKIFIGKDQDGQD